MSLRAYQQKRNFAKTPEPEAHQRPASEAEPLHFVVQKHQASHLHIDFRLELDGVLKSWAVPKGPSMDPDDRKLAMRVEDHPWDYRNFEGAIPVGEYGAGEVIIWDEGSYHVPGVTGRAENERVLRRDLERGRLHFVLEGQKLKGEFSLVRMQKEGRESWLLIKKKDEFATQQEVLNQDTSVRSGATLEEVKTGKAAVKVKEASPPEPRETGEPDLGGLDLHKARRGALPAGLQPMLASLAEEPFDRLGWVFEVKWDGFRALAELQAGEVRLISRNQQDLAGEFRPIALELKKIPYEAVLDGEIVVVDEQGRSSFKLLQNWRKTGEGVLVYYVFDLIWLAGYDLRLLPLRQRKSILEQVLPDLSRVKFSAHLEEHGLGLYKQALEHDLEGIIAKDGASLYRPGVRSTEWLKFKTHLRQEAVIGGFTEPRGSRAGLGALLLGVYEGKELVYVGHTGGGFGQAELNEMRGRLEALTRKTPPFSKKPKTNSPATWVEPQLVCEVRFSNWTHDGLMRQPVYMGLRSDKDPRQVRRERPVPVEHEEKRKKFIRPAGDEQSETVLIGERSIKLTHLRKAYWPEDGISKGEMIDYYRGVKDFLLPYLANRPVNLQRFPNGIQGNHFFQKDFDEAPDWVRRVRLGGEDEGEDAPEGTDYIVCDDEATLVWIANLGSIELNPWNSSLGTLTQPDYLIVDLDPDERTFDEVIQVAQRVHQVFEQIGVTNRVKTSGQTGLHICVPLGAQYSYAQARQFTQLVCQLVQASLPEITSLERSPKNRRGKIYLDFLQNRWGQTIAAPYSLRPQRGAPVSTPLRWEEVVPGLSPAHFTIRNLKERLDQVGDLWVDVLGPGMDMAASLARLQDLWKDEKAIKSKSRR